MQVKKKGQTCAEGLNINPLTQVCPLTVLFSKSVLKMNFRSRNL